MPVSRTPPLLPLNRTALAESELEYNANHTSPSIYLKLAMKDPLPECLRNVVRNEPVSLVIWTTTPWTLPANQAVCFNPEKDYCLVRSKAKYFVIASELRSQLEQAWSSKFDVITEFSGEMCYFVYSLQCQFTCEPFRVFVGRSTICSSTTKIQTPASPTCWACNDGQRYWICPHRPSSRTGRFPCCSTAQNSCRKLDALSQAEPNHVKTRSFSQLSLVNEEGCYSEDASMELSGLNVLGVGQEKVLSVVQDDIIHREKFVHSYPYDWRTKRPVILRASLQWFIDTDSIKTRALVINSISNWFMLLLYSNFLMTTGSNERSGSRSS